MTAWATLDGANKPPCPGRRTPSDHVDVIAVAALQSRTVPFDRCPEATSLSATELPSGVGSTLSSSSDGEPASGDTF
jgi:hypothetical protein